jgi:hypothetical protein
MAKNDDWCSGPLRPCKVSLVQGKEPSTRIQHGIAASYRYQPAGRIGINEFQRRRIQFRDHPRRSNNLACGARALDHGTSRQSLNGAAPFEPALTATVNYAAYVLWDSGTFVGNTWNGNQGYFLAVQR